MKYKWIYFCIIFLLFGCYKKDLDEFEKIKNIKVDENLAFPLFNATITINDSLNFPNFVVSDTLYLMTNGFLLNDSAALNFDEIKEIELKLYIENNFPIYGDLQIYFTNNKNVITDSLFTIKKYNVPYAQDTRISEIYISIDVEKYRKIIHSKEIKVIYFLQKTNSYSSSYKMFIGCGVKMRIEKTL